MATHDYVIDNQSAPALRSDLNNALLAIVSQNSNATAPTTTFANMLWYDTATNILKKRNEANSAWINLGTIDEGAGTFTPSGERALASQAQAEAGTDNATLMTPLRVAQAINVLANPADYESAEWTAAAFTRYTYTHGLGALPSRIDVIMRLTATVGGWSAGTYFVCDGNNMFYDGANPGIVTGYNTTSIFAQLGSDVRFLDTNGSRTGIPFGSCVFKVRAWK